MFAAMYKTIEWKRMMDYTFALWRKVIPFLRPTPFEENKGISKVVCFPKFSASS